MPEGKGYHGGVFGGLQACRAPFLLQQQGLLRIRHPQVVLLYLNASIGEPQTHPKSLTTKAKRASVAIASGKT